VPEKGIAGAGRRAPGVLAAVLAGFLAAACGSPGVPATVESQAPGPTVSPSASPAASPAATATPGPTAPLTGLAASAADASRRAVALVIAGSKPRGLADADVIFEEISSPVRYIAVFQSRQAKTAGPITSTEPADGQILSVLRPLTGYDGGTTGFIKILDKTKVTDLGYLTHSSLYRPGTDGLTASTKTLREAGRGSAPPVLFSYRGAESGSSTLATAGEWRPSSVTVSIPGHGRQHWVFDARTDSWAQVSGGPPIQVANLIVQTVPYKEVFLNRRFGITVPSARVFGRGRAEVFSGTGSKAVPDRSGVAAEGSWFKPGIRGVTVYSDSKGFPMELQPGMTWIILAPHGTRVRTAEARS
jgi:hypothetical protein